MVVDHLWTVPCPLTSFIGVISCYCLLQCYFTYSRQHSFLTFKKTYYPFMISQNAAATTALGYISEERENKWTLQQNRKMTLSWQEACVHFLCALPTDCRPTPWLSILNKDFFVIPMPMRCKSLYLSFSAGWLLRHFIIGEESVWPSLQ